MRRFQGLCVLVLILVLALGLTSLWRLLRAPGGLQGRLVDQIEERLGARLSFEESKIVYTPFPSLRMKNPRLQSLTASFPLLAADEAHLSFKVLPLFWGKFRTSGFEVKNGKADFGGLPLERIGFKISGMKPNGASRFAFRAGQAGGKEILRGKGRLNFKESGESFWRNVGVQGEAALQGLSLSQVLGNRFIKYFPGLSVAGELKGKLRIQKEAGEEAAGMQVSFESKDFQTGLSSPFSLAGDLALIWSRETESIEFQRVSIRAPFGELEGRGIVNFETGEVAEVRLTVQEIILEKWVEHLPGLQTILPVDMGFSGRSGLDLTLRGTWDYLTIHANADLTPAVLTYGKLFSKPKDFPMGVNFDFLLKEGLFLSGDFSTRMARTTVKGTITGLDTKTGEGELTVLTNKFDLKEWQPLLTPLAKYEISGSAKMLMHWKGNLNQLDRTEKTFNLTLEGGTLRGEDGSGIRNADVLLDASALSLHIKNAQFEVGDFPIKLAAEIYGLDKTPQGTIRMVSSRLNPSVWFDQGKLLNLIPFFRKTEFRTAALKARIQKFFPLSTVLEDWVAELRMGEGKITIENLSFHSLGGDFRLSGETEWAAEKPHFWVETEISRVSLARYFEQRGREQPALEGNLFLKGRWQGQGIKPEELDKNLSGRGTLSITNGQWHSFNLKNSLSLLEPLRLLGSTPFAATPFADLKASWNYAKEKFETADFLLVSKDLWVEGGGTLSLKGTLNSKLNVYLSHSLTQQVFESWGVPDKAGEKLLGPVPFLLVGSLFEAEARVEDRLIGSFLADIRTRRYRRILGSPFKD